MATAAAPRNNGVSPSSSPRLPSPPPFTEVQFGPKSPSVSAGVTEFSLDKQPDEGASRRIRPGTKSADMVKGPPFVPLHQLESPFQLQEYLQSLYNKLIRDDVSKTVKPVDKEMALELATPPTAQDTGEVVERNLWLYELCRFLCNKTTRIIVGFFLDNPPCSSQTCPEMRASEWQYLCAVHEPPKSCCAIDYCNHTLDWASNILSSSKHFPSRLSLGGEGGNAYQSMRQLTNIFRRVYRIYAHAWFQHREVFWAIESEHGLYMFFKTVCDEYQLIPEDNYTIPPEAEGERDEKDDKGIEMSILVKESEQTQSEHEDVSGQSSTGATTRRHKHTPSTGVPVSVIAEDHEEEEEETTILDGGGPGPAQENPSLSPPKPRIDRARSPGLIAIPTTTDADQVPEDPTPIAAYDSNPFDSPGPAEETDSTGIMALSTESTTAPVSDHPIGLEAQEAQNTGETETPAVVTNSEHMSTVLGHLKAMDDYPALDSDTETQIAIEDVTSEVSNEHELEERAGVANADEKVEADGTTTTTKLTEKEKDKSPAKAHDQDIHKHQESASS